MATQTKVNPAKIALGTLYTTLQLRAWKIDPDAAITSVDLAGQATKLAEEFGTTGALFEVKSDGSSMIVIGDSHALDADALKRRAANVLGVAESAVTVTELTSLFGN